MNLYEFIKAELKYSTEAIANDPELSKQIQEHLIWLGFLLPPIDGNFGPISAQAFLEFQNAISQAISEVLPEKGFLGKHTASALLQSPTEKVPAKDLDLENDLASRIVKYMLQKGYQVATNPQEYNIIYLEGMDIDGKLNGNPAYYFNDIRLIIEFQKKKPVVVSCWEATTEPGYFYNYHPINLTGAARIAFGQYKAWKIGMWGKAEPHEALIQVDNVTVHKEFDKEMKRTNEHLEEGLFDIDQHWGYDLPDNDIAMGSVGSLVGRTRQGHHNFINILKQDRRYQQNPNYLFLTAIILGEELAQQFPATDSTSELLNQDSESVGYVNGLSKVKSTLVEAMSISVDSLDTEQQLQMVKKCLNMLIDKLD